MSALRQVRVFGREVLASALAQRVTSIVTLLLVLGATTTVLVTAGRNAGAEASVLARIDAAGTRALTVYAQGESPGFTSQAVQLLAGYDVVEEVTGFGPVHDVTAAVNPDAPRVGMRTAYGTLAGLRLEEMADVAGLPQVWATTAAATALGMPHGRGSIREINGPEHLLTKTITVPEHLAGLEPAILQPGNAARAEPLASMTVIAATPADLPLVTALVQSALADVPRDALRVESSQDLADLRSVIGGELTRQSRTIILGVLAASAGAILVTIWSLVLIRRRDYGRRRALGATRTMITTLVLAQTTLLALLGAILGAGTGLALLAHAGHPLPTTTYTLALITGLTLTAAAAATLPALWAAHRDPLTELRIA